MRLRYLKIAAFSLIMITSSFSCSLGNNSSDTSSNCNPCYIFITNITVNGNFGSATSADTICESDLNNPGGGTYKALVVDSSNRIASLTANTGDGQKDWVIKPDTEYIRSTDSFSIFTSDSNGLFTFGLLTTSLSSSGTAWTGLASDWLTSSQTCSNWASSSSGVNGRVGQLNQTNSSSISSSNPTCSNSLPIICVEQ